MSVSVVRPKRAKLLHCLICTWPAQAWNLGCLSCGSCKVFFRRASFQTKQYQCCFGGHCVPNLSIRKCIACRLKRCYEMGMKRELIYIKSINRSINQVKSVVSPSPDIETMVSEVIGAPPPKAPPQQQQQQQQQQPQVSYRLTRFEMKCLDNIREAGKLFPDEKLLLDRQVPIKVVDPLETIHNLTTYINVLVRFANCFEPFSALDTFNQTKLIKHFFDYFLTIRMSFNFHGDFRGIFLFLDEGNSLLTLNWEALIETLIKDNELSKRLKAMIIEGSEALANDPMVRDIMFVVLLFQPNSQLGCNEYIQYYAHFFVNLLKRYLIVKQQSHSLGVQAFNRAMRIINICKESRLVAHAFFDSIELHKVPHLMTELYELV